VIAAAVAVGIAAAAVLAPAVDCPATGGWPVTGFDPARCPQVYRIHGTADSAHALDLLVLPDGFTADELDTFRCAAGLMIEKLVRTPPFHRVSDSIRVYRIDLASTKHGVDIPATCAGHPCDHSPPTWTDREAQCTAFAARSGFAADVLGEPLVPDADACVTLDLDARACPPTAQECQVLWPEGEGLRKLWRLAACAPEFDAVVVIANSGAWAGGGVNDQHPPMAVATLRGIDAWTTRAELLLHEFGHALGLLDEYPVSQAFSSSGDDGAGRPTFHDGRNLVTAAPGTLPTDVPWADLCTKNVQGLTRYAAGDCFTVCAGNCAQECDLPANTEIPGVGLFEGGFYSECEYFRPSSSCAMQTPGRMFCPACSRFLLGLFEQMGVRTNAGGDGPTGPPD